MDTLRNLYRQRIAVVDGKKIGKKTIRINNLELL